MTREEHNRFIEESGGRTVGFGKGDRSEKLTEEDEEILDRIWAEAAREAGITQVEYKAEDEENE